MPRVLVVGMATLDFVFSVKSLPRTAEKYHATDAKIVGGGPAANAAVAIARLGGTPVLSARLGEDALADLVVDDLSKEGVDTGIVHRASAGRTSFSSVYVDEQGERQILNYRGADLGNDTSGITNVERCDAVLVDTRWPDGAAHALDLARTWGVPGVLDAEAPTPPALLEKASHVAFSRTGLREISDHPDLGNALEQASNQLPGWACVTDGAHGVWYTTPHGVAHAPACEVVVKDTLAAGDVWHGAFTLMLAEGRDELDAIRFANAAAALKCTNREARAGYPDRASAENLLKENQ